MQATAFPTRTLGLCILATCVAAMAGCGGGGSIGVTVGGGGSGPPPPPPPPPILDPIYLASAASPFTTNCDGVAANGDVLYVNAEVEPYVVVDPQDSQRLVGVWQEDRWRGGGARGVISALSQDGGRTWSRQPMAFSRCGGGSTVNGGDYPRTSNPWVTVGPVGVFYESAISYSGGLLAQGSASAVLASRSIDSGQTWQNPATLIRDVNGFFNDRDAITADANDASFVYAVWDRIAASGGGPTMLARSTDGGSHWQTARAIYDPGPLNQTISNEVVTLPNGDVLDLFVEIDTIGSGTSAAIGVLRSTDHGATWSAPIKVADLLSVGTVDPDTGARVRDASIIPQMAVAPDGKLYVVFQDARFSNGNHDAIALVTSIDGGTSWSAPVRVNSTPSVAAFDPSIHVRANGTIGVTYYDFRNNTSDTSTLPTIVWLARSDDAATWRENAIAGPFDLDNAPDSTVSGSPGLFLGDNQGLTSTGNVFAPLFTQTNNGNTSNRTDIFSAPAVSLTTDFNLMARARITTVQPTRRFLWTQEFAQKVSGNLGDAMELRLPGWHAMVSRWQQRAKSSTP
ncbi:MAG TPA: sialidase family protein [Xanthomonadaceae bacterium]